MVPVARLNQFIFIVISLAGFFVAFTSAPSKDYQQLLPVLGDGLAPVLGGAW